MQLLIALRASSSAQEGSLSTNSLRSFTVAGAAVALALASQPCPSAADDITVTANTPRLSFQESTPGVIEGFTVTNNDKFAVEITEVVKPIIIDVGKGQPSGGCVGGRGFKQG